MLIHYFLRFVMQLFVSLAPKDSVEVSEFIDNLDDAKFKSLNQRERAICLIALKNCIFGEKQDNASPLSSKTFNELKGHLNENFNPSERGLMGKMLHLVISLAKGILNLIGLRISSKRLQQLSELYQADKNRENNLLASLPNLIKEENKKILRINDELNIISDLILPLIENTIKTLKGTKIEESILKKILENYEEYKINEKNSEMVSVIQSHIELISELLATHKNNPKSFPRTFSATVRKIKDSKASYQQSIKCKRLEIPKFYKRIRELQQEHRLLEKKIKKRNKHTDK